MPAFSLSERILKFGDPTGGRPPVEKGHGLIAVDRQWAKNNLVWLDFPYFLPTPGGHTAKGCQCHRIIKVSLFNALYDLRNEGLQGLIRTFDGCFVPRHLGWNKARALSPHTWGMAVDLNASAFPLNSPKQQDDKLIKIMARHGFGYGGNGPALTQIGRNAKLWNSQMDAMHFEYCYRSKTGD
jgi:hypothetical protein